MKKSSLYLVLAAMGLPLACAREASPECASIDSITPRTTFTCSLEDVKTTLGELSEGARDIYWSNGDRLGLNGVTSNALSGVGAAQKSADFTFDAVISNPKRLIYPASLWKDETSVTLPVTSENLPMSGYTLSGNGASLGVFTSVLKLTLTRPASDPDTHAIDYIRVTAQDGGQMSGDFAFDYSTATLTRGTSAAGASAYVQVQPGTAVPEEGMEVFIPVPAGTYGFTVRVADVEGHYMEKTTTTDKTLTAGVIAAMPAFDFVPDATDTDIVIASAEQWNDFAAKVQDNTYADGAAGYTIRIVNDLDFSGVTFTTFTKGFKGTLSGQKSATENYCFKNLSTSGTSRIIGYNESGTISHVDIDASCTYTVDAWDGSSMQFFALLCGQNRGTIEYCKASHRMNFAFPSAGTTASYYAGLVGRNHGTISHCEFAGTMVDTETTSDIPVLSHLIGGIVANNYNKQGDFTGPGEVSDCVFSGKILIGPQAGTDSQDCSGPAVAVSSGTDQLVVGGICGRYATGGSFTNNSSTAGAVVDVRGNFYNVAIAGVIGFYTIGINSSSNVLTNNAAVSCYSGLAGLGSVFVGGVAGRAQNQLGYAANNGAVRFVTNQNDANTATAFGVGGVVGACYNTSASASRTITHCDNTGAVSVVNISTVAPTASSMTRWSVGGVLGYANYLKELSSCTNSGAVTLRFDKKTTKASLTYAGGILGFSNGVAATVKDCVNTGDVDVHAFSNYGGLTGQFQQCPYGGGIAGGFVGTSSADATLVACNASGAMTVYGGIVGGLVGYASYASIGSAENPCSSRMSVTGTRTTSDCLQQYAAGLIGVASNTRVAACTYSGAISAIVKPAGLVAVLTAGGSIKDCVFGGSIGTVPSGSMHANMSKYLRAPMALVSLINATYNDSTQAANFNITHCGISGTIGGTTLSASNYSDYLYNAYDGSNTLGTSCKAFTYIPFTTDEGYSPAYYSVE